MFDTVLVCKLNSDEYPPTPPTKPINQIVKNQLINFGFPSHSSGKKNYIFKIQA